MRFVTRTGHMHRVKPSSPLRSGGGSVLGLQDQALSPGAGTADLSQAWRLEVWGRGSSRGPSSLMHVDGDPPTPTPPPVLMGLSLLYVFVLISSYQDKQIGSGPP